MSTQSQFSIESTLSGILTNQRQKDAKAKTKTDSIKKYNADITNIATTIIAPARDKLLAAERLKNEQVLHPGVDSSIIIAQQVKIITAQNNIINDENLKIDAINKKIKDLGGIYVTHVGGLKLGIGKKPPLVTNAPQGEKLAFSNDYKYNAPMVRSAYFGMDSIQSRSLDGNLVDQGNYTDARQAWKGVQGGRGTIQMDQKFLQSFTSSQYSSDKSSFDLQKYGFKFLYNPTAVQMAWGLMSSMDPVFEATGYDPFQVVATSLMSSTISFELMLNRIADFDYINENGLRSGVFQSSSTVNTTTLEGITQASGVHPYPLSVDIEDLKDIYRKGTMYDIEYLLKTINGPDGNFISALNGKTADRAWMRPTIVELHLGDSMHYRVRISEFSVNHIIFNNRMVPTLSTVRLTCSRFNDGPETVSGALIKNSTDPKATHYSDPVPGYGF
jgi:hypothetical protein